MKEMFVMFSPQTWLASHNAISLPASASGPLPCDKQGSQMTELHGPRVALASLSARQAQEQGLLTSGTYGPASSTCSISSALATSLESRSRQRTALLGSTLYTLTWKVRVTPLGRKIAALRASARRKSDRDSTSPPRGGGGVLANWPTPQASDGSGGGQAKRALNPERSNDLNDFAMLANWNTPRATDGSNGGPNQGGALSSDAALTNWMGHSDHARLEGHCRHVD